MGCCPRAAYSRRARIATARFASRAFRTLHADAEGRFAVDLWAGTWHVHAADRLFLGPHATTVEVGAQGLLADLVQPGHRLVFTIGSTGRQRSSSELAQQLWMLGPDADGMAPDGPFLGPAGDYVQWLVGTPGDYRIVFGAGRLVDGMADGLRVHVAAERRVYRGTLFVQ